MHRRFLAVAGLAALATATLLAVPGRSQAQGRMFSRSRSADYSTYYGPSYYSPYSYGSIYSSPYYSGSYYSPYSYRDPTFEDRYYYSRDGIGFSYGNRYTTPSYYYSSPYYFTPSQYYASPYSYGKTPYYASTPSMGGMLYSSSAYTPSSSYGSSASATSSGSSLSTPADDRAYLTIRVPSDRADVWIEGRKTDQSRSVQDYVSPPLEPGKKYYYEIRARWTGENGRSVDQTRSFPVYPGKPVTIDFSRRENADSESTDKPELRNEARPDRSDTLPDRSKIPRPDGTDRGKPTIPREDIPKPKP